MSRLLARVLTRDIYWEDRHRLGTFIGAAVILVPIYMMINAAIRPIKEILSYPPQLLPTHVTMEFFERIAANETYQRYFRTAQSWPLLRRPSRSCWGRWRHTASRDSGYGEGA